MKLNTLLFFILFIPGFLLADELKRKEFTKEISKVFSMNKNGEFILQNKHGKVDIKTWNKSSVKVDVLILVQAKDEENAAEVFERINIDISNDDNFVKAITRIESKKKSGWGWNTSTWNDDKSDFEINYEVFLPNTATINITNKYGDAFIAKTDGLVNANIGYGNIRFEEVNNTLNLKLSYGDASVNYAEEIKSEIKYSKFRINKTGDADINTKYSNINLGEINSLRSTTKYDEYNIEKVNIFRTEGNYGKFKINSVNEFISEAKYTDYIIRNLNKEADIILNYGLVEIENISPDFEDIRMNGSYVNFHIENTPEVPYRLEASASYGSLELPEFSVCTYQRESGYSNKMEGEINGENSDKSIKIKVNYGDVRIK